MPHPEPAPGLCGAQLKGGRGYCGAFPLKGCTRCRVHGGVHERRPPRGASARGDALKGQRVQELMDNPRLMDERWTVARLRVELEETLLSDEAVAAVALTFAFKRQKPTATEIPVASDADRVLARLHLLTKYAPILRTYSAILTEAKRMSGIDALLREEILPVLGEYHESVKAILMRASGQLPPERQAAYRAELNQARLVFLGRVGSELDVGGEDVSQPKGS